MDFLKCPVFCFVGRGVNGDIAKLGRDFKIDELAKQAQTPAVKTVELGMFCKDRGCISTGKDGLAAITEEILGKYLPKDLQISDWN